MFTKRRILAALVAALVVIGVIVFGVGTASAHHGPNEPYAWNQCQNGRTMTIKYNYHNANGTTTVRLYDVAECLTSPRGMTSFRVPFGQRVLFQSMVSGAYYWSKCGINYDTWQGIGNSINFIKRDLQTCL